MGERTHPYGYTNIRSHFPSDPTAIIPAMDRERLKRWLDDGLSLEQIAEIVARDPSTVGHWCKKHGLTPNGRSKYAPRGGLTREQLEPLLDTGLTLREIAAELDRSVSTVRHWLKRLDLAAGIPRRRAKALAALESGHNRFTYTCRHHGEVDFLVFAGGRSRCSKCNSEHVSRRRQRTKATLAAERGGRCALCGYDRYLGALQFHHRDRESKKFAISSGGFTRGLERAREEARKCTLLCANCHAEVEGGFASLGPGT